MDIFNYDKMTFFVFYVDLWTQLFRKCLGIKYEVFILPSWNKTVFAKNKNAIFK